MFIIIIIIIIISERLSTRPSRLTGAAPLAYAGDGEQLRDVIITVDMTRKTYSDTSIASEPSCNVLVQLLNSSLTVMKRGGDRNGKANGS